MRSRKPSSHIAPRSVRTLRTETNPATPTARRMAHHQFHTRPPAAITTRGQGGQGRVEPLVDLLELAHAEDEDERADQARRHEDEDGVIESRFHSPLEALRLLEVGRQLPQDLGQAPPRLPCLHHVDVETGEDRRILRQHLRQRSPLRESGRHGRDDATERGILHVHHEHAKGMPEGKARPQHGCHLLRQHQHLVTADSPLEHQPARTHLLEAQDGGVGLGQVSHGGFPVHGLRGAGGLAPLRIEDGEGELGHGSLLR